MKELTTKITNFASEHDLNSNDVLTISLRIASMEMIQNIVQRIKKPLYNITTDDILLDYLEIIDYENIENIGEL